MLALRTSTSLSALGLVIGIAGTSWLTALTYERAPAARPFAEVVMPGIGHAAAPVPLAPARHAAVPAANAAATAPRVAGAPVRTRYADDRPARRAAPAADSLVPVYMPAPRYPIAALRAQREGKVILSVTVTPEGNVADVTVGHSSGDFDLDRAAEQAVRNWRFASADTRADRYTADLPVRFEITRPD